MNKTQNMGVKTRYIVIVFLSQFVSMYLGWGVIRNTG